MNNVTLRPVNNVTVYWINSNSLCTTWTDGRLLYTCTQYTFLPRPLIPEIAANPDVGVTPIMQVITLQRVADLDLIKKLDEAIYKSSAKAIEFRFEDSRLIPAWITSLHGWGRTPKWTCAFSTPTLDSTALAGSWWLQCQLWHGSTKAASALLMMTKPESLINTMQRLLKRDGFLVCMRPLRSSSNKWWSLWQLAWRLTSKQLRTYWI